MGTDARRGTRQSRDDDLEMTDIRLSYILVTLNKLAWTRHTFPRLLEHVEDDEELIVVDGGSTDGTREYLEEFVRQGRIHHFLSEWDRGEAHALNKGLLLARGQIIKGVTDDDAFDYGVIRQCRNFLLANEEFDFLGTPVPMASVFDDAIDYDMNTIQVEPYLAGAAPVAAFNGLGLMVRRSSLSLIGLCHPGYIPVDFEFTLRATSLARLAWCTAAAAMSIGNAESHCTKHDQQVLAQVERLCALYGWWPPRLRLAPLPPPDPLIKRVLRSPVRLLRRTARYLLTPLQKPAPAPVFRAKEPRKPYPPEERLSACLEALQSYNATHGIRFLWRSS